MTGIHDLPIHHQLETTAKIPEFSPIFSFLEMNYDWIDFKDSHNFPCIFRSRKFRRFLSQRRGKLPSGFKQTVMTRRNGLISDQVGIFFIMQEKHTDCMIQFHTVKLPKHYHQPIRINKDNIFIQRIRRCDANESVWDTVDIENHFMVFVTSCCP